MTSTPRFQVHPIDRRGAWITNHRKYYLRAHFALGEVRKLAAEVAARWPVGGGDAIPVEAMPEDLHRLCTLRDTFADSVVVLAGMSVEAFLNYYGLLRLGEEPYQSFLERFEPPKKLRALLLFCDGIRLEKGHPLGAVVQSIAERRNRLVHPKTKEVDPFQPVDLRTGELQPDSSEAAVAACDEFYELFEATVPNSSHLIPKRSDP